MGKIQKAIFSGLIIFCAAMVLGACSPDPDPTYSTDKIEIKNIPTKIPRSQKPKEGEPDTITYKDTFKVYIQLSTGINDDSGNVALGVYKIDPAIDKPQADGTYTITIDLYKPDKVEYWKLDKTRDSRWSGTDWSSIAIVMSPEEVTDIFDIDAKAALSGPSDSSSTVTLDLDGNGTLIFQKKLIGLVNYQRLYGMKGFDDGVIVTDNEIKGSPARVNLRADYNYDDKVSDSSIFAALFR